MEFLKQCIEMHKNDENYYTMVLSTCMLPKHYVIDNLEIFNLEFLIKHCVLDDETIQFILDNDLIPSHIVIRYQILSENLIEKYFNENKYIKLMIIYQNIDSRVLTIHKSKLDWELVSTNQFMDLQFLIENLKMIEWHLLPFNSKMLPHINEGFITLFQQTNIWDSIGYTDIPTETIMKYEHKLTHKGIESLQKRIDSDSSDDDINDSDNKNDS